MHGWLVGIDLCIYIYMSKYNDNSSICREIPRDPIVVTPATILYRDDGIFADYDEYLVPEDVHNVSTPRPWNTIYDYI